MQIRNINHFFDNLEPKFKKIDHVVAPGETFNSILENYSIQNDEITSKNRDPYTYAFCSDTRYNERILEYINRCTLLYHESTFLHLHKERASDTNHSTAIQAGTIAMKAEVRHLLIGHFFPKIQHFSKYFYFFDIYYLFFFIYFFKSLISLILLYKLTPLKSIVFAEISFELISCATS